MKVITAKQAAELIQSGKTIALEGFVGAQFPEYLAIALKERFLETGSPKDLTLVFTAGMGDGGERGLNHLSHKGLIKRAVGGHWNLSPKLGALALNSDIEAYNFSIGVISQLFRYIAAHKPGNITKIGLNTFIDPRVSGGKLNSVTTEDLVELLEIGGEQYLFYKSFPIHYCFLRGSFADGSGNISFEDEGVSLSALSIAQAVKNSGGQVIVQVKEVVDTYLDPWKVKIPGIYTDFVVVAKEEHHMQTFAQANDDTISGKALMQAASSIEPLPFSARKIICRRCALELTNDNDVVNLGIGMPEGISLVAFEEGISHRLNLTVEAGPVGGVPLSGMAFGCAKSPSAILDQNQQFDFYQGGGLDIAFLGLAQLDENGDVNVSKFGTRIAGCGGFIDITQSAKKVVFCGTLTAKGAKKFVKKVEQITFSAKNALINRQPVLYVTEVGVFRLTEDGVELIEIAPGVDIERDIQPNMDFVPRIAKDLKTMDGRIFNEAKMGLV